jgi:hypothetical protein
MEAWFVGSVAGVAKWKHRFVCSVAGVAKWKHRFVCSVAGVAKWKHRFVCSVSRQVAEAGGVGVSRQHAKAVCSRL